MMMTVLGAYCPVHLLYAGHDQWGPESHVRQLELWIATRQVSNYHLTYNPDLRHDYVSYTDMVPIVVDWGHQALCKIVTSSELPTSRL